VAPGIRLTQNLHRREAKENVMKHQKNNLPTPFGLTCPPSAARQRPLIAMTLALALGAVATTGRAEITEDCILEGTVDMRKAEQIGQPVYVRFEEAYQGKEARCTLNQHNNRRRVKFISSPDLHDFSELDHGSRVRYRYVERDGEPGRWQLIEVTDSRK